MNRGEALTLTQRFKRSLNWPPLPWTPRDIVPLKEGQRPRPQGVVILEHPPGETPGAEKRSA